MADKDLRHTTHQGSRSLSKTEMKVHREIISRPNPLSGSGFNLIHRNPPRGAPDPPSSAPTGSRSALIQARASFQIRIYVRVIGADLDFYLSTCTGSCLALIHA